MEFFFFQAHSSARQKFAQNALPQAVPRAYLTEIYFRLSLTLDRRDRSGQESTVFSCAQEVDGGLRRAGYVADSVATTTVFLTASLHRPVFSEGPAGSGKTQLAYAVAAAANKSVERLQCYEGIGENKAIGKFDEWLQRLCVELKAKAPGVDWELLKLELHGEQVFCAGPLLRALQCEKPCVLLIDELDKLDHAALDSSPSLEDPQWKKEI